MIFGQSELVWMRFLWVCASLVSLAILPPFVQGAPDDHFQGIGRAVMEVNGVWCGEANLTVVVERTSLGDFAHIQFAPPLDCRIYYVLLAGFLPIYLEEMTYRLTGSWEDGYEGRPVLHGALYSSLSLGPYSPNIPAKGCIMCDVTSLYVLWQGSISDTSLL